MVSELRRETFVRASEKLDPEQFNLPLEDVEIAQGVIEAVQERVRRALNGATDRPERRPMRNRGHLPKHLPRIERVFEPGSMLCPCGCGEMTKIGEDVSERLDIVPAQLRVLVTRRPRYACRRCSGAVVQAHAPEHVVPGGLLAEALIAQVIVSKFGDHMPFYRQAGIYRRQGIALDRATLGNRVGRVCSHLRAGIDTVFVDFRDNPTENTVPSIQLLGRILDERDNADEFTDFYNEQMHMIDSRVASIPIANARWSSSSRPPATTPTRPAAGRSGPPTSAAWSIWQAGGTGAARACRASAARSASSRSSPTIRRS
ncbi:IS66 family transposase zinc-finger binding domain-containing protein [Paracoccus sp. S-4012]|uniref:IS66 family transposase zinc-finger binding domain-containing protein n=1 Tax=Paracoccus sp. S-4012 TaxID=2665648 RepID=UPI00351B318A